ncbi:MAG TPA: hypothetical protein GXX18_02950 [Bacillales bacterium]|nr:hypothetical protein [Bacillales bacterium]
MEKTINLAELKNQKQKENEFIRFVEGCTESNKEFIADNIIKFKGQYDSNYIIDIYTDQMLSMALESKDKDYLLEVISNGNLFKAKQLLVNGFKSDFTVRQAITKVV